MILLGSAATSLPAAYMMQRYGRRPVFIGTCFVTSLGACCGFWVVYGGENKALCSTSLFAMCFLIGVGQGVGFFYRFAVVEVCAPIPKEHAMSMVILGGVLSAFVGPYGSSMTKDALSPVFVGSFVVLLAFSAVNFICVMVVQFPMDSMRRTSSSISRRSGGGPQAHLNHLVMPTQKPIAQIMCSPETALAVSLTTLAHTTRLILLGPVTLAIQSRGYSFHQSTAVLCCHFICMFLPSFQTGALIARHGPYVITMIGGALFAASSTVLLCGEALWNFWLGMALVGLAWNLLFNSGSVLLTSCYEPGDAIRVQGINDVIIFGISGISELGSGFIYEDEGWHTLVWIATGGVLLEVLVLGLFRLRKTRRNGKG